MRKVQPFEYTPYSLDRQHMYGLNTNMVQNKEPFYKDHAWEKVKSVFVHRWSLFGGSVSETHFIMSCQFKKNRVFGHILLESSH